MFNCLNRRNSLLLICLLGLSGCVVNPVTGQREIALISAQQEISIGQEQYVPSQQMQGGVYRTDPGLSAYVNQVGQKLAVASGVDLPYEFVVLNNSVPNAWALPGGKIAINRGLLTELRNEAELAAVLGHEIAHAAARHGAKRVERGILSQGVMIAAAIGASGTEYSQEVLGSAALATQLFNQKYSRDAEREADFYGTQFMAKAGYDPLGAVTLQETFVRLAGAGQTDWINGLFASHPASQERLNNNRGLLKQLRSEGYEGGVLGQPAYARAMQDLRQAEPAYKAYDEARELYAQGRYDAALAKVNTSLSLRDNEALFHGLRGSIRYRQERYADAITNFDRALERDDSYFLYYLSRGLSHAELGRRDIARRDLSASVRLLPTAPAYQALGKLAEADGDLERAKQYYAQAGQSNGQEGQAARASLVRLELPSQPAKYIAAGVSRDDRGRLVLQVSNRATLALADIVIQVEWLTANGVRSTTSRLEGLGPGETRLSLLNVDPEQIQNVNAYPVSARLKDQ
ncbi:MAG: M48 family metalloprotease [bacterium]